MTLSLTALWQPALAKDLAAGCRKSKIKSPLKSPESFLSLDERYRRHSILVICSLAASVVILCRQMALQSGGRAVCESLSTLMLLYAFIEHTLLS